MKLLEAIFLVAKADESIPLDITDEDDRLLIDAAHRFIFGKSYSLNAHRISASASEVIKKLNLGGEDFTFINNGANGTVYGNDAIVFKIGISKDGYTKTGSLKTSEVPEDLGAKVIATGVCNGVKYDVCERLNTQKAPSLADIIPLLFKVRDKKMVYWDPDPSNFGYDKNGVLKVADLEHFKPLARAEKYFETSLKNAVNIQYLSVGAENFPMVIADTHNTYIIFDPTENGSRLHPAQEKRILAGLKSVGIESDNIESLIEARVMKINRTEATYGTPPESHPLADYLKENIQLSAPATEPQEITLKPRAHLK